MPRPEKPAPTIAIETSSGPPPSRPSPLLVGQLMITEKNVTEITVTVIAATIQAMRDGRGDELTIEELARRVGMTVRNLREWQGQGLLEPPVKRGRVAYYRQNHVERVERVRSLQADGFPLDLIRRILRDAEGAEGDVLDFGRALQSQFQDEEPEVVGLPELVARFGMLGSTEIKRAVTGRWLKRAAALGLVRVRKDGRFEVLSPRLARLAEFLLGLGISMDELLSMGEEVQAHQKAVADVFVRVYRTHVFEPFERAGSPSEGWAEIRQTLEELRPFALDAVTVLFKLAMDRTAERTIQEEIERRESA